MSRSGLYSRSGHSTRDAWDGSNHSQLFAHHASRSWMGRGYLHPSDWRTTTSLRGSPFISVVAPWRFSGGSFASAVDQRIAGRWLAEDRPYPPPPTQDYGTPA